MRFKPEYTPPAAPMWISGPDFDEADRQVSHIVKLNVSGMEDYTNEYTACAAMIQQCLDHQASTEGGHPDTLDFAWAQIGAKQGIVALYNYRAAMDGIFRLIRTGSRVFREVDRGRLERVRETFRARFPHTRELRQTVLHNADLTSGPERHSENEIKKGYRSAVLDIPPGNRVTMAGHFEGRGFVATFAGQVYRCDFDADTVRALVDITRDFFGAFPARP